METHVFKDMFITSFPSMEIYGLLILWRTLCFAAVPSITKLMSGLSAETRSVCQHYSLQNIAVDSLSKRHLLYTGAWGWLLDFAISWFSSLPAGKCRDITSHCTTLSSLDIIPSRVFASNPILRAIDCATDISVNKSPINMFKYEIEVFPWRIPVTSFQTHCFSEFFFFLWNLKRICHYGLKTSAHYGCRSMWHQTVFCNGKYLVTCV
jgi:hypothetical protein